MIPLRAVLLLVLLAWPAGATPAAEPGDDDWAPPPDARNRLESILQDPVFQLEEPEPGLTQKIMGEVRGFLFRLFSRISAVMALNATLVTVLLWTVIVLALIGTGWLIIRLTRDRFSGAAAFSPVESRPADEPEPVRSPDELLDRARAALGSGDGRQVLALCLQAAVRSLRLAGHLPDDRTLTDLEGTRVLERSGPEAIRKPFRTLAHSHDRLVNAGLPAGAEEMHEAVALAGGIVHDTPPETGTGADS